MGYWAWLREVGLRVGKVQYSTVFTISNDFCSILYVKLAYSTENVHCLDCLISNQLKIHTIDTCNVIGDTIL